MLLSEAWLVLERALASSVVEQGSSEPLSTVSLRTFSAEHFCETKNKGKEVHQHQRGFRKRSNAFVSQQKVVKYTAVSSLALST